MHSLAAHIDCFAEKLRNKYVTHDGKKKLVVVRPSFVKGRKENDWSSVINEFSEKIDKSTVNNVVKLLENDFSTTTEIDKISTKVCLMAVCKHYFKYVVRGGCGFPAITLEGNKNDWIKLKEKVETVLDDKVDKKWGDKWKEPIFDILNRFIDVFNGEIDCLFWNSMVRRGDPGSGRFIPNKNPSNQESYYGGWINILFPYLNEMQCVSWNSKDKEGTCNDANGNTKMRDNDASFHKYSIDQFKNLNKIIENNKNDDDQIDKNEVLKQMERGSSLKIFPIGLANAPVLYQQLDTGKEYNFKFSAGFIGVGQDKKSLEVCSKVGWFIAEQ